MALPDEPDESIEDDNGANTLVCFGRVSSKKQEIAGDLARQIEDLRRYAGQHYPELRVKVLKGVGSGLNDSRPEFLALIDLIVGRKISVILVTYRERVARFGLNVIQHLCRLNSEQLSRRGAKTVNARKEHYRRIWSIAACRFYTRSAQEKMMGIRGGARTKIVFPAGFRERVPALFGGGLSLRDVVKIIEGEKWRCLNTNRILGWKPCRRVMLELGARAVIPASVQTFVKRRCTVGASKRETTAALYDAYALHCAERKGRPLTRDNLPRS